MAFCQRCSLMAFAEVSDQFNGIGCYSGTAIEMHLQKFWTSFPESRVMMTSEWHFGRPDGVKLALKRRLQQPCGTKLALERPLGHQAASSWSWNGDWDTWNDAWGHLATPTWPWTGVRSAPGMPSNKVGFPEDFHDLKPGR